MIQPAFKNISTSAQQSLKQLQDLVNAEATFEKKVEKAQSLWKSKGGAAYREAFEEIKEILTKMCVSVHICNYCEQSKANDIEHIAPKSFFPELVFVWFNYLLACKQCNTGLKLDKCYVLDDNNDVHFVKRGTQPPYSKYAFINPRFENPNDFMILNMRTYKFDIDDDLGKANKNKAEKTIEILELNEDETLIAARRAAAIFFYQRIQLLIDILNSNSIQQIKSLLTPEDDYINTNQDVNTVKNAIKSGFKNDIQTHQHPSVWYAIKTIQIKVNSKWIKLQQELPEAFTW